jgi:hypothetical protein
MINYSASISGAIILILTTISFLPGTSLHAESGTQGPEQRIAAIQTRNTQQADYLNGLANVVRQQKRDAVWAAKKESDLFTSYETQAGVPRGSLKSVDCRSSKCSMLVQISDESLQGIVDQQNAITQWISGQSCGYTISSGPGVQSTAPAVQIFLDCNK